MPAQIIVQNGPQKGRSFPIDPDLPFVFGRKPDAQVILYDLSASRNHAKVERRGSEYWIVDFNSSNGTYVNEQRIESHPLSSTDVIRIGTMLIKFVPEGDEPIAKPPAPPLPTRPKLELPFVRILDDWEDRQAMAYSVDAAADERDRRSFEKADTEDMRRIHKRLSIVNRVSQQLANTLDLTELLDSIMTSLFDVFPQAQRGILLLKDPKDGVFDVKLLRTADDAPASEVEIPMSRTILSRVTEEKRAVLSSDAMGDDRFDAGLSIVRLNIRSMMCAPLIHQDDLYGIVHIDTTKKGYQFESEDLDLLMGIANQAAIFMRNAELVKSIESESKIRANYERYFSPSTQDRIRRGEISLGGSMKKGSVFFSDIIGFTRMSQERSPSEVVAWLNRYFRVMVEIITKHRGTIDKFGGDSILAVWGIEEESDCAIEAVRASLEMQNALYDFNFALVQSQQPPIQMGIGINSGCFIFGNIGSELRTEYTVIGSDVNMAQRVESKATRGQVYISDTTFAPLQGACVALRLPPTCIKGRCDPMTIYSIRGLRSLDSPDLIEISMPVEVKASGGGYDPYGLFVRFVPTGKTSGDFVLHSAQDLPVDERTNCRLLLPEYQDFPIIEGMVCETRELQPEQGIRFYIIRIQCNQLNENMARFLSCDFIPDATTSADEIERA